MDKLIGWIFVLISITYLVQLLIPNIMGNIGGYIFMVSFFLIGLLKLIER